MSNSIDASAKPPRPRSALREFNEPFVGNACADDNIAECAQLALWTTPAVPRGQVNIEVHDGSVILTGRVATERQRDAAAAAVAALDCVATVTNAIALDPSITHPELIGHAVALPDTHLACAVPMVYVTRYVSLFPASLNAAIANALTVLRRELRTWNGLDTARLAICYRNRHGDTVSLDIGYLVETGALPVFAGELRQGTTPAGEALSIEEVETLPQLLAAREILIAHASAIGRRPAGVEWQVFGSARRWPAAPLNLLLEPAKP